MRLVFPFARNENTLTLLRRVGYNPDLFKRPGEAGFHRRAGSFRFPRFHIYVAEDRPERLVITLHLDMKQPSYQGSAAHAGEYNGPVVTREAERISRAVNSFRRPGN